MLCNRFKKGFTGGLLELTDGHLSKPLSRRGEGGGSHQSLRALRSEGIREKSDAEASH